MLNLIHLLDLLHFFDMCTNMRWVKNPYTKKNIFVPCGHCPACQQEKANKRTARIKNNSRKGYINLFVTLTYKNDFVPYILRSDIESKCQYLTIYRRSSTRKVRCNANYGLRNKNVSEVSVLDRVYIEDSCYDDLDISSLRDCNHFKGAIGVAYYKDLQDFNKRLRINLKRHFNYEKYYSSFQCSEYGSASHRPHFHLLVSVPFEDVSIFRQAIFESWPFDSKVRRQRGFEIAKNAASYVSSYVNKSASFPQFLAQNCFKQKHSYSQGFGMGIVDFSISKIQEKVRRRDLSYNVLSSRNGIPEVITLPVPEYVINRYYPKFKGYSRLTSHQIYNLIRYPLQRNGIFAQMNCNDSDAQNITTALFNSFTRYKFLTNYDICDSEYIHRYAMDFIETWKVHEMNKLKFFYENKDNLPPNEMYDNFSHVVSGHIYAPTLFQFIDFNALEQNRNLYDPNKISSRLSKTASLEDLYYKKLKTRHITNEIMSRISDSF